MPTTTPPAQAPRVRPLWERADLFREPEYADGPYAGDDDLEDDTDS
ncbi:hypothetical protein [Streptomyces collinus]